MGANDTFGLNGNDTILGYQIDGTPHVLPIDKSNGNFNNTISTLENSKKILNRIVPMYLPSPGIISVDINSKSCPKRT